MALRLAMLAILSFAAAGTMDLPLGRFACADPGHPPVTVLTAMLVLGMFRVYAPVSAGSGFNPSAGRFAAQLSKTSNGCKAIWYRERNWPL